MSSDSTRWLSCVFQDKSFAVPLTDNRDALRADIGSSSGISADDVVALMSGNVVYPLSFVTLQANFNPSMFGNKELYVLARGEEAVPEREQEQEVIKNRSSYNPSRSSPNGFSFSLAGVADNVQMSEEDLENFVKMKTELQVDTIELEELYIYFRNFAEPDPDNDEIDVLGIPEFHRCIRGLVPGSRLDETSKKSLSVGLSKIFYAFDIDGNDTVDFLEFFIGFSILGRGTEEDKLRLAFALCDEDEDGLLSGDQLKSCLRSFLIAVLALTSDLGELPPQAKFKLIDDTTESIVHEAFDSTGTDRYNGRISFKQIHAWYYQGGSILMPWVLLLGSSFSDSVKGYFGLYDVDDYEGVIGSKPVSEFQDGSKPENPFLSYTLTEGNVLNIMPADVDTLSIVLSTSHLGELEASEVIECFQENSISSFISDEHCNKCIISLVPKEVLREEHEEYLSEIFRNVFDAYDTDKTGRVNTAEISCGFIMLASGRKSRKLWLTFKLFDQDKDGRLTGEELARYLRSFLVMLIALKDDGRKLLEQLGECINEYSQTIAELIVLYTHKKHSRAARVRSASVSSMEKEKISNTTVSFEEFGEWYNEGGDEVVQWIELLDLTKWPLRYYADSEELVNDRASENYNSEHEHVDLPDVSIRSKLSSKGDLLEITNDDIQNLEILITLLEFGDIDPVKVHTTIDSRSRSDGLITKKAFFECCHEFVDFSKLPESDRIFLVRTLQHIFDLYDREESGMVPNNELSSGLSFLATGNKSPKLALAFGLFDQNENEQLSTDQIKTFLGSFLTTLLGLVSPTVGETRTRAQSKAEIWTVIDTTIDEVAANLAEFARRSDEVNKYSSSTTMISFKDFADWYQDGGHNIVHWLELLDISKWNNTSNPQLPSEGEDDGQDIRSLNVTVGAKSNTDSFTEARTPPHLAVVISFPLGDQGDSLDITSEDIATLRRIEKLAKLHRYSTTTMKAILEERCDENGDLTNSDFVEVVQHLIQGPDGENADLSDEDLQYLVIKFHTLFNVYSEDGVVASLNKLICGMSLFAEGKKSDKLYDCFTGFCNYSEGVVIRAEMHDFILAFLLAICSINKHKMEMFEQERDAASILFSDFAVGFTTKIFHQSKEYREDANMISFEEFATWYSEDGCNFIHWLELLDRSKWPAVSPNVGQM